MKIFILIYYKYNFQSIFPEIMVLEQTSFDCGKHCKRWKGTSGSWFEAREVKQGQVIQRRNDLWKDQKRCQPASIKRPWGGETLPKGFGRGWSRRACSFLAASISATREDLTVFEGRLLKVWAVSKGFEAQLLRGLEGPTLRGMWMSWEELCSMSAR